ncbi:MAG: 16S ribosomal RNA methyltransferase A [Sulfolobales archaeon]|nr:16S ribosomal RNA methyltransferase A [Sulfolobales archaeon]
MRLGQHFLVEKLYVDEIVSLTERRLRPLIEIGGGKGSITRELQPDAVLELDSDLARFLEAQGFSVVVGDARSSPLRARQVVSSLPYYITFDFLESVSLDEEIMKLVLILQKDVVDKLLRYSTYVSFLVNLAFRVDPKSVIPPQAFEPRPKVYSQIVVLDRIRAVGEREAKILKCLSRYRNKTLRRAADLCDLSSESEERVRDFAPHRVTELLSAVGLSIV